MKKVCPICSSPVPEGEAAAPFCSHRCKTIDLGNWAMGKYVISRHLTDEELGELPQDAPHGSDVETADREE